MCVKINAEINNEVITMLKNTKGCYVYYDPNGGCWENGSCEAVPSPTENGILYDHDTFIWPEGTEKITRKGYRIHTSQNYLNVVRFYTADGKGNGYDTEPSICNGFGYDCWPGNAMELTDNGHDANFFAKEGMGFADGQDVKLYICWDPIVIYDLGDETVQDFVYKTGGDEYKILAPGENTNYALNRSATNIEGYTGSVTIPEKTKNLICWLDNDGNKYFPGSIHTVTEPLILHAVYK